MPPSSSPATRGPHKKAQRLPLKVFLSLQPPPGRDWAELPLDLISSVFHQLSSVELLVGGAAGVCRSWRRAAREEPELWGATSTCLATAPAVSDRMSPSSRWCEPPCASAPGSVRPSWATKPMTTWSALSPSSENCEISLSPCPLRLFCYC